MNEKILKFQKKTRDRVQRPTILCESLRSHHVVTGDLPWRVLWRVEESRKERNME